MIEILGILIGFCSIMLMFSILVTSIVQAISSTLNFRARNLSDGLISIAKQIVTIDGEEAHKKNLETRLLELIKPNVGYIKRKVGYVSYEQVIETVREFYKENLEEHTEFSIKTSYEKRIKAHFERIEHEMAARFQAWMNWLSIIVAFFIVCLFQINSFELLKKLSLDEDYRVAISAYYEKVDSPLLLVDSKELFLDVNEKVNSDFIIKYREQEPSVEQLSAVGNESLDDALLDYSNALASSPDFLQAHYLEYKSLLKKALELELKSQRDRVAGSMKELTEYDFEPLPNGTDYFSLSNDAFVKNWLGMIISSILISLGSPFWFTTVRNLIGLRDMISSPSSSQTSQDKPSSEKSST